MLSNLRVIYIFKLDICFAGQAARNGLSDRILGIQAQLPDCPERYVSIGSEPKDDLQLLHSFLAVRQLISLRRRENLRLEDILKGFKVLTPVTRSYIIKVLNTFCIIFG